MFVDEKSGQLSFFESPAMFNKDTRLWREFLQFHSANPQIYEDYKKSIFEAIHLGRKNYSISLLTEHNRWDRSYKISNNHRAYYARMFVEENPQYKSFFRLRPIKGI